MHKHKLLKWKYTNLRNDESKYLRTFLLTEYWNMKDKVENPDNNMLYLKILKTVEILLKKVSVLFCQFHVHYLYYLTDLGRLIENFHRVKISN